MTKTTQPKQTAPDVVRQSELQAVIDLQNQSEVLAASIRKRLEAGAKMEHGKLGVTTHGHPELEWYGAVGGAESADNIVGLTIEPVKDLAFIFELLKQYPDYPHKGITLA